MNAETVRDEWAIEGGGPRGERLMSQDEDPECGGRGRHGRRRGRKRRSRGFFGEALLFEDERASTFDRERGHESDALGAIDESLLSEEERAYRVARRLADEKVILSRNLFRAALITVPLLIFVPFAGVITLIYFSMKIGRRAFKAFYEPKLHARFVEEEIQQQVRSTVNRERRNLEGEHHRSLEQLSARVAHEIRNPITAAKSLVQQMGEDAAGVDQEEYARVAVAELERVERSISHLLRYAREEETRFDEVVMEDVLASAIETFRDRAARSGIEIAPSFDAAGQLEADAEQLRRVVINLLTNAMDALEEGAVESPRIRVSMGENLAGSEVWVRISDNGRGIDPASREQIFDPFYTSRKEGTGLGLALCRKIVDNHGGTISVQSPLPGTTGGTEFVLTFPRDRSQAGGRAS